MRIEDVLFVLIDALQAENVEYLLTGSFASNFYGIARSTQAVDFVVQLGEKPISCLQDHLGPELTLDPQMAFETITGTSKHVVNVADSAFQVELFRLSNDPHDQERFRRRGTVELLGRTVFLPTSEDVIITKLRWFRRKDYDDVQNVITVQGDILDWAYIHHWCQQHGTRRKLDEIRTAIPLIDVHEDESSRKN